MHSDHLAMRTTGQRLMEHELDAAIASTQECRDRHAMRPEDARSKWSEVIDLEDKQPSAESCGWLELCTLAVGIGCLIAAIFSATSAVTPW